MDFNPSFSPDEESIAYSSDHNGSFEIYARSLAPGAREVQLTTDGQQNFDPAWSPDGKRIAYYSMKRHGVFTMPAFGGLAIQLTDFGSHPVWSPDGQSLAFQSVSSPDLDAVPMGGSTIWIVGSQGGAPKQVTHSGYPAARTLRPHGHLMEKRLSSSTLIPASPQVWTIALSGDKLQAITKA
jgi:Tol biopolymer transport system component